MHSTKVRERERERERERIVHRDFHFVKVFVTTFEDWPKRWKTGHCGRGPLTQLHVTRLWSMALSCVFRKFRDYWSSIDAMHQKRQFHDHFGPFIRLFDRQRIQFSSLICLFRIPVEYFSRKIDGTSKAATKEIAEVTGFMFFFSFSKIISIEKLKKSLQTSFTKLKRTD